MSAYLGQIILFAGPKSPATGWLPCNGQLLSLKAYFALYELIGTLYGGDGKATFGLPDLRDRIPVGAGSGLGSTYALGQAAGRNSAPLDVRTMPTHSHPYPTAPANPTTLAVEIKAAASNATLPSPAGNIRAQYKKGIAVQKIYSTEQDGDDKLGGVAIGFESRAITLTPAGQTYPDEVSLLQPFLALNYYIFTEGIFPVGTHMTAFGSEEILPPPP